MTSFTSNYVHSISQKRHVANFLTGLYPTFLEKTTFE